MENWDADIIDTIKKRKSVRTYAGNPISQESISELEAFFPVAQSNPFGAKVRLDVINAGIKKVGTYGFIKGAKTFFGGWVKKGGYDLEGFGYSFEKAVLYATYKGFGTCWLGGLYDRYCVSRHFLTEDGLMPAVSPVGIAAEKRAVIERIVSAGAGAKNRKEFGELFIDKNFSPLELPDCALKTCLEMVRLSPSASNRQPWRVIVDGGVCHFYLLREKYYAGNILFGYVMQRIDMGIAACHFELTAKQTGLKGGIVFDDPKLLAKQQKDKLGYSFSWR